MPEENYQTGSTSYRLHPVWHGEICSESVMAIGGKYAFPDDDMVTPDTMTAVYDFKNFTMIWEHDRYRTRNWQRLTEWPIQAKTEHLFSIVTVGRSFLKTKDRSGSFREIKESGLISMSGTS